MNFQTFFLRFWALSVFFSSVCRAAVTACLLLLRISSRWCSISVSVAVGESQTPEKNSKTDQLYSVFYDLSMQLSLTHHVRELVGEGVTVLQEEEEQEMLLHWGNIWFSAWILTVFLLHCVHSATALHEICRGCYDIVLQSEKTWRKWEESSDDIHFNQRTHTASSHWLEAHWYSCGL